MIFVLMKIGKMMLWGNRLNLKSCGLNNRSLYVTHKKPDCHLEDT